MSIGTKIMTMWRGKLVGKDQFGNRYYTEKKPAKAGVRRKRWVMYEGMAEASKVPPLWHGWLHYMIDTLPDDMDVPHYEWQKEHQPNLTGTAFAYKPKGDLAAGGVRAASTSDYEPWTP